MAEIDQAFAVHQYSDVEMQFSTESPVNISGWSIEAAVEDRHGVDVLTPTVAITDGPAGEFEVTVAADDFDLDPGVYFLQVARTDAGSEEVLAEALMTVLKRRVPRP